MVKPICVKLSHSEQHIAVIGTCRNKDSEFSDHVKSIVKSEELKLVLIIFRHGDRSPLFPIYPFQPYSSLKYWPEGYGQLTNILDRDLESKPLLKFQSEHKDVEFGNVPRSSERLLKDLFEYLSKKIGKNVSMAITKELASFIQCQISNGYPFPSYINESVFMQMKEVENKFIAVKSSLKLFQQIKSGLLFDHIKNIISTQMTRGRSEKKVYFFSTHMSNLAAFLNVLKVYNGLKPPFGATIFIEMFQEQSGSYFLKLVYLNVTESNQTFALRLPACNYNSRCEIEQFFDSFKHLNPHDFASVCSLKESSSLGISMF
ncbi:hypothetical protein B4U79_18971 [Dinothrombium tinctorium]|uniref:acid phosphatase n=1 Tax=Dinothrombium tinctorium TaxID=1965070 RepID=A0A443RCT7_9ACAR|nr:hypothetical protein B4U79_18971 [Dinothrombium tinctorium]